MELEDLRVGDVVDCAYSIHGENPIFAGKYSGFLSTTFSEPVQARKIRLLWPAARSIFFKERLARLSPMSEQSLGALRDLRWSADDLKVLVADADTPTWALPLGWLQISEYRSWGEVVEWALAHYKVEDVLPPKLEPVMQKIRAQPSPEAQIRAALEYVQDDIRYLSISEGVHSHEPYTVQEIVERGFGDCKDKARLLCAMLRKLGFDAVPALIATSFQRDIAEWLPTPQAFNHVVVRVKWNGQTRWLDATVDHQRGALKDRFFPDFGETLVIENGSSALIPPQPNGMAGGGITTDEHYLMTAYNKDVTLNVRLTYRGFAADTIRAYLASKSLPEFGRDMLNFRAREFPGLRAEGEPTLHDDEERNEVTIEHYFQISDFWQPRPDDKARVYAEFYAHSLASDLEAPSAPQRSAAWPSTIPRGWSR